MSGLEPVTLMSWLNLKKTTELIPIYTYLDLGRLASLHMCHNRRQSFGHRRRINTEEKVKVVAAIWGADLFNSLPR